MTTINDILGAESVFLVALFIIIPVSLFLGYKVRTRTNFDYPTDFFTGLMVFAVLVALYMDSMYGVLDIPILWFLLFLLFYFIGHRFGRNVNDKDKLELVRIYGSEDGNICISTDDGEYFKHPQHGLCRLPETNAELFNQLFRGIYHTVETNAPLEANIILDDPEYKDVDLTEPNAKVMDERTGMNAILIEDIKTAYERDTSRFLSPAIPRTVIRLARGSAIPKTRTLFEFGVIDRVNKALGDAEARALKVETEIIPALPSMSANQLVTMTKDNPIMGVVKEYMDWQNEKEKVKEAGK